MKIGAFLEERKAQRLPAHSFICLALFGDPDLVRLFVPLEPFDLSYCSLHSILIAHLRSSSTMQPARQVAGRRVFKIPALFCTLSTCPRTFRNRSGLTQHLNWHRKLGHIPPNSTPSQTATATSSTTPSTSEAPGRMVDPSLQVRYERHTVIDGQFLNDIWVRHSC